MPKILVRLADGGLAAKVQSALAATKTKYTVAVGPALSPGAPASAVAREFLDAGLAAVIVDYIAEDAFGVKVMQAVNDSAPTPQFLFVLPDGADLGHALMAINEGAAAVLPRSVDPMAVVNYVERAINGPSRFRRHPENLGGDAEDGGGELERDFQSQRQYANACQKLISYLLATPPGEQNRKALIVSDSSYQRELLKDLLENHGFGVAAAPDAEAGLALALAERPLIVISDLEMDGMNGVEFCRALKIERKYIPCHFVICTANQKKRDEVMVPGNGVDACIAKPASENDNLEFLTRVAMGLLLQSVGDRPTRAFTPP